MSKGTEMFGKKTDWVGLVMLSGGLVFMIIRKAPIKYIIISSASLLWSLFPFGKFLSFPRVFALYFASVGIALLAVYETQLGNIFLAIAWVIFALAKK
jgi:hypothetical protein